MLKECAITAIINMVEIKNHGTVLMINYMQVVYVKIAISITIIRKGSKLNRKNQIKNKILLLRNYNEIYFIYLFQ